jgi:nitrile hydratase accessory protein
MVPAGPYEGAAPELEGIAAYPRKNGEPVFEAPWQSRVFGIVVSLNEQSVFEWDQFKRRLVARIAADERDDLPDEQSAGRYYEHWTGAFHDLAIAKGLLSAAELARREEEFRTGVRRDVY